MNAAAMKELLRLIRGPAQMAEVLHFCARLYIMIDEGLERQVRIAAFAATGPVDSFEGPNVLRPCTGIRLSVRPDFKLTIERPLQDEYDGIRIEHLNQRWGRTIVRFFEWFELPAGLTLDNFFLSERFQEFRSSHLQIPRRMDANLPWPYGAKYFTARLEFDGLRILDEPTHFEEQVRLAYLRPMLTQNVAELDKLMQVMSKLCCRLRRVLMSRNNYTWRYNTYDDIDDDTDDGIDVDIDDDNDDDNDDDSDNDSDDDSDDYSDDVSDDEIDDD